MVQLVHNAIKEEEDSNAEIAKQMQDPDARRLLYESLDNYNAFALQFPVRLASSRAHGAPSGTSS